MPEVGQSLSYCSIVEKIGKKEILALVYAQAFSRAPISVVTLASFFIN
jgi:hypothetical protein